MTAPNPIDLLFADMDKLSPGDDTLTLHVLRSFTEHRFEGVVEAGCGAGRQTFVLANNLKTSIHAITLTRFALRRSDPPARRAMLEEEMHQLI
jgi:hypothetical protein